MVVFVLLYLVSFCAWRGKRLSDHFVMVFPVNGNFFPTKTIYFIAALACSRCEKKLLNTIFMATKHLTLTDFVIPPELLFTGCAFKDKHVVMYILLKNNFNVKLHLKVSSSRSFSQVCHADKRDRNVLHCYNSWPLSIFWNNKNFFRRIRN